MWDVGFLQSRRLTLGSISTNSPYPDPPQGEGALLRRNLTKGFLS